jgi:tRNA pseudouridine38-40 synthase
MKTSSIEQTEEKSTTCRKYKAILAYDGTSFSGWQYQDNALGIQQVVEEVLADLELFPVRVFGSSRTDAGVHARGFVCHFHLSKPIPPHNLLRAMNSRLPPSVRVMKASYVPESFDARLSAKGKEYRYHVYQADILPPHMAPYWTFCHRPLDLEAMRKAASYFVGRHDFLSFAANPNRELETTVRNIFSFEVKKSGPRYTFIVKGDGFLYKQVRSMAGFLLSVGKGNEKPEAVKELLSSATPRTARVETAPSRGLSLWKVFYKANSFKKGGKQ